MFKYRFVIILCPGKQSIIDICTVACLSPGKINKANGQLHINNFFKKMEIIKFITTALRAF